MGDIGAMSWQWCPPNVSTSGCFISNTTWWNMYERFIKSVLLNLQMALSGGVKVHCCSDKQDKSHLDIKPQPLVAQASFSWMGDTVGLWVFTPPAADTLELPSEGTRWPLLPPTVFTWQMYIQYINVCIKTVSFPCWLDGAASVQRYVLLSV